jgi:hypothetical protein
LRPSTLMTCEGLQNGQFSSAPLEPAQLFGVHLGLGWRDRSEDDLQRQRLSIDWRNPAPAGAFVGDRGAIGVVPADRITRSSEFGLVCNSVQKHRNQIVAAPATRHVAPEFRRRLGRW